MTVVQDRQDAAIYRCQGCGEWRYAWFGQVFRPCPVCGDERGRDMMPGLDVEAAPTPKGEGRALRSR